LQAIKSVGAGSAEWKETYTLKEFSAKSAIKEVASKSSSSNSSTVLEVTAWNHNTLRPDGTIGSGTVDLSRLGSSQLSGSGDRVTVHLTDKKVQLLPQSSKYHTKDSHKLIWKTAVALKCLTKFHVYV